MTKTSFFIKLSILFSLHRTMLKFPTHTQNTPFFKAEIKQAHAKTPYILIGIVLLFCLFSFQITPALAMERLPWKIKVPSSKNTIIQGKVVEQITPSSQKPISGALVEVLVFNSSILAGSNNTNANGDYNISGKLNGEYYIKVSRTDYETQTTQKETFKTGGNYPRSFVLKRKPPKDTIPPVTTDSGIDGVWHNQPVTVILKAQDNLSGVYRTYYSLDGSTPRIVYQGKIVVSQEGTYTLRYYSKDKTGNVERIKAAAKQIKIDKTPPQGSIQINNTAPCTNNLQVNLQFPAAKDSGGSGLSQMQFYNQGDINPNPAGDSLWTAPESYSISKSLTLPSGDGQKKIFARFKDTAGNWSVPVSAVIILDTSSPPAVKFLSPLEGNIVTGSNE